MDWTLISYQLEGQIWLGAGVTFRKHGDDETGLEEFILQN